MPKLAEQLKQGADQAWESLSEGWRELSARASGALTRFRPAAAPAKPTAGDDPLPPLSSWAFMAADVFDDDDKVIVRIEAPGMRREDFNRDRKKPRGPSLPHHRTYGSRIRRFLA